MSDSEKVSATEETVTTPANTEQADTAKADPNALPTEIGGRNGPEPTRFGDWEKNGRCVDF